MLQLVGQYDPNFDAVNYNARNRTRTDFTSGKSASTINALNTVTQHLDRLGQSADKLGNFDWGVPGTTSVNAAKNWLASKSGGQAAANVKAFMADKKAVTDELTRAWRQAGGSEQDVKSWSNVIDQADSPTALHGAIAEMGNLLEGKLSALGNQYGQGMGTAPIDVVTPQTRQTLTTLENRASGQTSKALSEGTEGVVNGVPAVWKTVNGKTGWYRR
jgi:hypothetical protein